MVPRIARSRPSSSSSPIKNSNITTPSSETGMMLSGVPKTPIPYGPMMMPAVR